MGKTEYGLTARALQGDECGDAGLVLEHREILLCALIDGVGHGPTAAMAATTAKNYIEANCEAPLTEILQGMHEALKSTQGAVACLCRIDLKTGQLTMGGIGNITCRIFRGLDSERLLSREGILGYMASSPREHTRKLDNSDLLLIHSDGVREHFELFEYPGLLKGNAASVAARVVETLGKNNDDASCLAVRFFR
jgi:Serine phosphatase RsbU, regulator of sigma subunit